MMITRIKLAGLVASMALTTSATSIAAQTETELGSRIPHAAPAEIPLNRLSSAEKSRATILAFSTCVVMRSRPAVEHALSLPADDALARKALVNLATSDCLRYGELDLTPSLMRGGLFNALYRSDFSKKAPSLYNKPIDYRGDVNDPASPTSQSYLGLHNFADCVVRADPEDSRAIALASVASEAETTAFSRLSPALSGCVTIGQNIGFSKIMLTGALSEAIYRQSTKS